MFLLKDKLKKIVCDTFSDNIICDSLVMMFIMWNFLRLLKDILLQIEFWFLVTQNQLLVVFLLWVDVQYHENVLNKMLSHDIPWKQRFLL